MTRFIWRLQFAAVGVALGIAAGSSRAADSYSTAAPAAQAAPAQAGTLPPIETPPPAAEAAPATEALPPGTSNSGPATEAVQPAIPQSVEQLPPPAAQQAAQQPVQQYSACEANPGCKTDFHPLATLSELHPLAPLREFHPLAPARQRFAECHTAPAVFPGYDGQPRCVGLSKARQAAAYSCAPQPGPQPAPQMVEQAATPATGPATGPVVTAQAIEPADPNAVVAADGSGVPVPAAVGECPVESPAGWFDGAEYLLIRPHQTYDSAYEVSPNGATGPTVQNVNFNPGFGNAVRLFVGYTTACDESLRFSYTYMYTDTLRQDAVPTGSSILSPLGATLFPGDSIAATQHLLVNIWDLEDVKKLNLPWLNGSSECRACPCWDVSWSWGVRLAQIDESILDSVDGPDAGDFTQKSSFFGVGPRLGIDVRRQLGHSRVSAYVAADAALLVGEQHTTGTSTPSGSNGVQALPNFDVQVGLSWQPTCHINFTTGYLFETFGDAVQLSEAANLALLAPPQASSLSYDGFFFRGEFKY